MSHNKGIRRTAVLTLVLASVLFTAGAGPAAALDRASDDLFGARIFISLLDRMGDFITDLATEVIEVLTKEGSEISPDG